MANCYSGGAGSWESCPSREYVLPDILDVFQGRRESGVLGHLTAEEDPEP